MTSLEYQLSEINYPLKVPLLFLFGLVPYTGALVCVVRLSVTEGTEQTNNEQFKACLCSGHRTAFKAHFASQANERTMTPSQQLIILYTE